MGIKINQPIKTNTYVHTSIEQWQAVLISDFYFEPFFKMTSATNKLILFWI